MVRRTRVMVRRSANPISQRTAVMMFSIKNGMGPIPTAGAASSDGFLTARHVARASLRIRAKPPGIPVPARIFDRSRGPHRQGGSMGIARGKAGEEAHVLSRVEFAATTLDRGGSPPD